MIFTLTPHLIQEPEVPVRYPVRPHTFVFPSSESRRTGVSYWWMYMYVHEVLVNRLGGLSLPRKSVGRLTDRPDMAMDVYRGQNTTQKHIPRPRQRSTKRQSNKHTLKQCPSTWHLPKQQAPLILYYLYYELLLMSVPMGWEEGVRWYSDGGDVCWNW